MDFYESHVNALQNTIVNISAHGDKNVIYIGQTKITLTDYARFCTEQKKKYS